MRNYVSKLKRCMSALLATVMLLGLAPLNLLTMASAADGAPANIQLKDFPSSSAYYYYDSPLLGPKQMAHEITVLSGGSERIGFCANHGKRLGNSCEGSSWGSPTAISSNTPLHFACYIGFYQYYAVNDDTDFLGDVSCLSAGNTRYWSESATQAYIWAIKANPGTFAALFDNWEDDPSTREPGVAPSTPGGKARYALAKERAAAGKGKLVAKKQALTYTVTSPPHAGETCGPTDALAIWDSEMKIYGMAKAYHDYYETGSIDWALTPDDYQFWEFPGTTSTCNYSGHKSGHQGLITGWPTDEPHDDHPGYAVKIKKTDADGKPLAGARFTFYEKGADGSLKQIGEGASGGDGYAYCLVGGLLDGDYEPREIIARETYAPSPYKAQTGDFPGTVTPTDGGNNRNKAVELNGGEPVKNSKDPDSSTSTLRKIDSRTGEGVGPATFRFKGTAFPNEEGQAPYDACWSCDENGLLQFQWTNPKDTATYIPPGDYTVTEEVPPPGYAPTDQVEHLVLRYDDSKVGVPGADAVYSSGPLVFSNDKLIRLKLYKTSNHDEPLEGAEFDLYKDGALWDSGVTNSEGYVYFNGRGGGGLTEGLYKLVETKAPVGYLLPTKNYVEIHIDPEDVTQGEDVEVHMINYKYPEILIIKKARDGDKALPGATFKITIDGHDFIMRDTDENGEIRISQEEFNDFLEQNDNLSPPLKDHWTVRVQEIGAPAGYLIDEPDWQEQELYIGQALQEFTFSDTAIPEIWVRKLDAETKKPLAGAVFSIEIDGVNNTSMQFTTSEEDVNEREGWHKITYEEYGRYLMDHGVSLRDLRGYTINVTELHAPQFYNKDKQLESTGGDGYTLTGQLHPGETHIDFTFYDTHYRNLKVKKTDSETQWPLLGAEFTLKCISLENPNLNGSSASGGWQAGVSKVAKTNADGYIVFENLPNGRYELTETAPPQGYHGINDTDSTKRGFWTNTRLPGTRVIEITSGSAADGTGSGSENRVLEYTYSNEPKSGINIFKRDGVTLKPIKDAVFKVTPMKPVEKDPFEVTTDESGHAVIESDLTNGTYMVEEIFVPEPYNLDPTPMWVEVGAQHDAYVLNVNNFADGWLYIRKMDSANGIGLAGARFEVRTADGKLITDTLVTDDTGYCEFGPLDPGESYVVTEIEPPPGYLLSQPSVQTFKVPENSSGWVANLIFKDDETSKLWLRKVDAETGKGLEGAEFKITRGDGSIVKNNAVTDQQGYIKVDNLEPGTYIVTEITAPIGYMLDPTPKTIHLESSRTEIFIIKNTKPGGLSIRKVDASTGEALEGASFQLYDINDKPLGAPVKTGKDGYARWADLEPGQYMVEEVTAPAGYARTTERKKFEVKEFKALEYEWPNAEEATITIYKRDGETFLPLSGAEFEIQKQNESESCADYQYGTW